MGRLRRGVVVGGISGQGIAFLNLLPFLNGL
jgi:hypothetical protein